MPSDRVDDLTELAIDLLDLIGTVLLEGASEEQRATFELYQLDWETRLGQKRVEV